MRIYAIVIVAVAGMSLSGCGTIVQAISGSDSDLFVGAAPLKIDPAQLASAQAAAPGTLSRREFLGSIVQQSEVSCDEFMKRLVVGENTTNTAGDVVSTALSALATAFTPLSTVHALTAGAAIATGAKTAVDSDIYSKAAIGDFATAIQGSYYKEVLNYTTALPALTDTEAAPLVITNEISKIQSFHAMCALAPAESAIKATLASPAATPSSPSPPASSATATTGMRALEFPGTNAQKQIVSSAAIPGSNLHAAPQ